MEEKKKTNPLVSILIVVVIAIILYSIGRGECDRCGETIRGNTTYRLVDTDEDLCKDCYTNLKQLGLIEDIN